MELLIGEWLDVIDRYYLSDLIVSGGSAFKLLVAGPDGATAGALDRLRELAERQGCLYAGVSAAETRIDRIDNVLFAITRQIDWGSLMAKDARDFLDNHHYRLPNGADLSDVEAIAQASGRTADDFRGDVGRATARDIVLDRAMCKEFRTALAHLRNAQFFPRNVTPSDTEVLSGWLRGEKVSSAALRNLQIYSKIDRRNARDVLRALAHWLGKSQGKGLVIGIDLSALLTVRPRGIRPEDFGSESYSRIALLDAYEVLRQFIDETDEIDHCLICACAPPGIRTDEKRSLEKYLALWNRLVNEVHDLERQNPLAAMVRVAH
jgi:hypothetical protein